MDDANRPGRVVAGYVDTRSEASTYRDAVVVRTEDPFPGPVRRWRLGDLNACLFVGGRIDAVPHRWRPAPPSEDEVGIVLGYVEDGTVTVRQGDRVVELTPGDVVLYDGLQRYGVTSAGPHRYLVAHIPGQLLRIPAQDREVLVARPLRPYLGATALASILAAVSATADQPTPAVAQHLGSAVVACVRAIVAATRSATVTERSDVLYGELVDWLDAHLGDPALSTERLASEHFLSARYVRKLFYDHGTTVRDLVRERRLERIRDELIQPWTAGLPVAVVAARWGITDPSVFSRAFSRKFGTSPRTFRQQAGSSGTSLP